MKKVILSVILYSIVIALTLITLAPYSKVTVVGLVVLFSVVAGFLLSLTLIVWYEGSFRDRLAQAAALGFPLAAASFIFGYVYIIVESLIRG